MTAHDATVSSVAMPFSARLRDETREDHERAESSPFVTAYLAGRVPIDGYAALQGQLWSIYDALESSAVRLRDDPVVGPFLDPRLDRLPALDADLRRLVGDDWRDRVKPSDATEAHAARIRELARTWPAGFIAHHYIRYLGDLSGGRALGSKARKLYQLEDDGVRFYRFDAIESPREFKDGYRRLLDDAPWSPAEQARIVAEARTGFRMTGAMFEELDRTVGAGVDA
ncbi:MAG: biliverdin-producing heme oxygenase [Candidatus Limnocylindrales bacterium]